MTEPVIRCALKGNPGNVMFVYLTALRLRDALGTGRIVGVHMPLWGIDLPDEQPGTSVIHFSHASDKNGRGLLPVEALAPIITRDKIDRIELEAYCQHTGNLPDRKDHDFRSLFDGSSIDVQGFGPDTLAISVRGGEILDAIHADYTLVPIPFYRSIIDRSGLRPAFIGQLAPNAYTDALRAEFPDAVFVSGPTPLHDFERLRRSRKICLSVSTFAWMAAWLSDAERIIMPVSGLFNPNQHRASWFIPQMDERYEYHLFPINRAINVRAFSEAHLPINGLWRQVEASDLVTMFDSPPRKSRRLGAYLAAIDSDGASSSKSVEHYVNHGFWAGETPFRIDRDWYSRTYPDAAAAIGSNEYDDEAHHYVETGRRLGYRPGPGEPAIAFRDWFSGALQGDRGSAVIARTIPTEEDPSQMTIGSESVSDATNDRTAVIGTGIDPLTQAAIRHGSDKFGGHLYTPVYHQLFQHLRGRPIRLLEIGVGGYDAEYAGGLGLRMWADYFPQAQITGLDVARKKFIVNDRVEIVEGSQADVGVLERVVRERGPFDIIIDDGSHVVGHMIASFRFLYPLLKPDGFYAVEDTQTSFRPQTGGRADGAQTIFTIAHQVSLSMHALEGFADGSVDADLVEFGRITQSVTTYRNIVVFRRGANTYPSNVGLDFRNEEVRHVFEMMSQEALRAPTAGNTLSRIDMLIWGGRNTEAAELARHTAERTDDRSVLHELVRLMDWCRHVDVRDEVKAKLATLDA